MIVENLNTYRIKGFIVGESLNNEITVSSINTDVDKVPDTNDDLRAIDDVGFPKIVGGLIYVYQYAEIDDHKFRAVDVTSSKVIGNVGSEDLQSFMVNLLNVIE